MMKIKSTAQMSTLRKDFVPKLPARILAVSLGMPPYQLIQQT